MMVRVGMEVRGRSGFLLQNAELVFFGFEVFVAVGTDFAVGTGFVRAAVSGDTGQCMFDWRPSEEDCGSK